MGDYGTVLLLSLLPAAGNFLGGVLAEVLRVSQRTLSLALHIAAGVVLAVVGIELVPEALASNRPWLPLLTFVAGGVGFIFALFAFISIYFEAEPAGGATCDLIVAHGASPTQT